MIPGVYRQPAFPDHELLDSGGGEKLERFGALVLRRPDPQALWRPRLGPEAWAAADLTFERESDRGGRWRARPGAHPAARVAEPEWEVAFGEARFLLRPTPFKHVGLFPEQAATWRLLADLRPGFGPGPRLLNLFGYTGAASVIAAQAGFAVTHVDASRQSLAWLGENAARSGLPERALRILLEDALVFARREARRGSRYEVLLVDPPSYGRGPKGEKWELDTGLAPLVEALAELVAERALLVLSTYAVGHSPLSLANLLADLPAGRIDAGELALPESARSTGAPRWLPAGFCARWSRGLDLGPATSALTEPA